MTHDDQPITDDPDAIPGMDIFVLRIRLGNDSMNSPSDVSKALSQTAVDVLFDWNNFGKLILDENGNSVGSWSIHAHASDAG